MPHDECSAAGHWDGAGADPPRIVAAGHDGGSTVSRRTLLAGGVALSALIVTSVLLSLINDDDGGFAPDPDVVAGLDGAALFAQSCAQCHGAELDGTRDGPSLLDNVYRPAHHGDGAFVVAVRTGVCSRRTNGRARAPLALWQHAARARPERRSTEGDHLTFIRTERVAVGIE